MYEAVDEPVFSKAEASREVLDAFRRAVAGVCDSPPLTTPPPDVLGGGEVLFRVAIAEGVACKSIDYGFFDVAGQHRPHDEGGATAEEVRAFEALLDVWRSMAGRNDESRGSVLKQAQVAWVTVHKSYVSNLIHDLGGWVIECQFTQLDGAEAILRHRYGHGAPSNLVKREDSEHIADANRDSTTLFDADRRWVRFAKSASSTDQIELVSDYVDTPATGSGPVIRRKDGRGLPTVWNDDAAHRLTELHRPGYTVGTAHRTGIEYDAGSRPWRLTDGNGTVVEQAWGIAAREVERRVATLGTGVSPLATRERISFDELGRIVSAHTDQGLPCSWIVLMRGVDVAWDSLGRKTQEAFT